MRTPPLAAAVMVLVAAASAVGQTPPGADLKHLSPDRRVTSVTYCRGRYDVGLGDGTTRTFGEYDLAFKIDSSANGPDPGVPALVPAGRVGDRAFVVFAAIDGLKNWLKKGC